MLFLFRYLSVFLFLFSAFSPLNADSTGNETLIPPDQLVNKLKQGGYTLYIRHATTDHSVDDRHPVDFNDCNTQRNLSKQGQDQAKLIGSAIKRLGIQVGDVQSSPYCRCRDTAQLAFGSISINKKLYSATGVKSEERKKITNELRSLLAVTPDAGSNNVIVSHTSNLREATGVWPKPEGVVWVFQPDNKGGFKALGKITPSDWDKVQ